MIDNKKPCAGRVALRRGGRVARGSYHRLSAECLETRALLAANQFDVFGDYGDGLVELLADTAQRRRR